MTYQEFSSIMKTARIKKNLRQEDMAKELGTNIPCYNRMENGKQEPTFLQLQIICEVLLIDIKAIFQAEKPNHIRLYD